MITIDLTGPDGNAFALLGYAKRFSKQLGLDKDELIKEMSSGDYTHLVKVFKNTFGKNGWDIVRVIGDSCE